MTTIIGTISKSDLQAIFERAAAMHGVKVKAEYRQFQHPEYRSSVKGDMIYVAISDILNCITPRTMLTLAKAIVEKEVLGKEISRTLNEKVIDEARPNGALYRERMGVVRRKEPRDLSDALVHLMNLGLVSADELDWYELCWLSEKKRCIGNCSRSLKIVGFNEIYDNKATPICTLSYILYCEVLHLRGRNWRLESDKHPDKERAVKWLREHTKFKPDSVYSIPQLE